jgi:serine/threonine-protein kinase haspin
MDASDGSEGVGLHWTPFDEEVFEGEGDYQFDIYRMMREVHGGDWEGFRPLTNVMVCLIYFLSRDLAERGLSFLVVALPFGEAASLQEIEGASRTTRNCKDTTQNGYYLGVVGEGMLGGSRGNRADSWKAC